MKESVTYQAIVEEGELKAARTILLRAGRKKFGPPEAKVQAMFESLADLGRLEDLCVKVQDASSWEELIQT